MFIFAHRGASKDAPENTLSAIRLALTQQADGIEIDVHQVGEHLMVIHDRWLHRTTSGKGLIYQQPFEAIRQLDAGNGEQIPTLVEVLACIQGQCILNIEVKALDKPSLLLDAIDYAITHYGFSAEQFLISSFDHPLLVTLKQLRPTLSIGALTASIPHDYAAFAQEIDACAVNCDMSAFNQAMVTDAHQRGLKVYVYTVDQAEDILTLHQWGVDGIFTNYPARSKQLLTSQ